MILPDTPATALPPVTLVKKCMNVAKIEKLYFIPFCVNSSMTI